MSVLRLQFTKCWGSSPDPLAGFKGPIFMEDMGGEGSDGKGGKGRVVESK